MEVARPAIVNIHRDTVDTSPCTVIFLDTLIIVRPEHPLDESIAYQLEDSVQSHAALLDLLRHWVSMNYGQFARLGPVTALDTLNKRVYLQGDVVISYVNLIETHGFHQIHLQQEYSTALAKSFIRLILSCKIAHCIYPVLQSFCLHFEMESFSLFPSYHLISYPSHAPEIQKFAVSTTNIHNKFNYFLVFLFRVG